MRTTRETIGKDRYVTGWQLVRRPVDPPKWKPPAQPCGAWAHVGRQLTGNAAGVHSPARR